MVNSRTREESYQRKLDATLAVVYRKSDKIKYETDHEGNVTLLLSQDRPIQRLFRKLRFRIPRYRRIKLDILGSFVFTHINGRLSVKALGELVEAEFGDKAQPIYQRLLTFLNYMCSGCHYIERVRPA